MPLHRSVCVQGLPSSHTALDDLNPLGGQDALVTPLQCSAMSHWPAEARHSKLLGFTASAGQLAVVPVQVSSGSQTSPEPGRHTVIAGLNTSAGQAWVAAPVQLSAVSHTPADARHRSEERRVGNAGTPPVAPDQSHTA